MFICELTNCRPAKIRYARTSQGLELAAMKKVQTKPEPPRLFPIRKFACKPDSLPQLAKHLRILPHNIAGFVRRLSMCPRQQ